MADFKGIRLNWVLIIAGLIPLWAALFIIFTNMRTLKDDDPFSGAASIQLETPVEELTQEEFVDPEEPKSIFKGLLDRFRKKDPESNLEAEINFTEQNLDENEGFLGIPRSLKRLWGATFVLIFLACLAYGSERALNYVFKEYRWVIGTTNPWTSQLKLASVSTSTIATIATMISTLRTGLYLLKK